MAKVPCMTRYILLFTTTHAAIKTERLCKAANILCAAIPVPRKFSSDCSIGIEVSGNVLAPVKELLAANNITAQIHEYIK
jgi:hypothetical protein